MLNLAESFSLILTGLKAIIAQIAFKERDRTAFLVFVHGRIGRTLQRFEHLYARWKNGTLPKPRTPRPAATRTPGLAKPPAFRLLRGRAWLLRDLQHYIANGRASQFRHLLANTPELAEFLAAAPQAARLLNPVCRMLGATLVVAPGATLVVATGPVAPVASPPGAPKPTAPPPSPRPEVMPGPIPPFPTSPPLFSPA